MPKLGIDPVRRRQIIAATQDCPVAEGLTKTSLIQHHFRDRKALLEETFRMLSRAQSDRIRRGLARTMDGGQRLCVILQALVLPEGDPQVHRADWAALRAVRRPLLQRLAPVVEKRLLSRLHPVLYALGGARPQPLARGLAPQEDLSPRRLTCFAAR